MSSIHLQISLSHFVKDLPGTQAALPTASCLHPVCQRRAPSTHLPALTAAAGLTGLLLLLIHYCLNLEMKLELEILKKSVPVKSKHLCR
jgi:hypothetical protein